MSHPTMGAWIEIINPTIQPQTELSSHPTMGAWIEIFSETVAYNALYSSHPTMGAWIEIIVIPLETLPSLVAPHDGCVD